MCFFPKNQKLDWEFLCMDLHMLHYKVCAGILMLILCEKIFMAVLAVAYICANQEQLKWTKVTLYIHDLYHYNQD